MPLCRMMIRTKIDDVSGEELRRLYEEHGYVIVEGVLSPEDVETVKDRLRYLIRFREFYRKFHIHISGGSGWQDDRDPLHQVQNISDAHFHDEILMRHILNPPTFRKVVNSAIGDSYCSNGGAFFLKPPLNGSPVGCHQDSHVWFGGDPWENEKPPELFDAWIAFDEATVENGCLQLFPGSEKYGILPHPKSDEQRAATSGPVGTDPASLGLTQEDAVYCTMKPGDLVFWKQDMLHQSDPNHSVRPRLGMSLSLIPVAEMDRMRKVLCLNRYRSSGFPLCIHGEPVPLGNPAPLVYRADWAEQLGVPPMENPARSELAGAMA